MGLSIASHSIPQQQVRDLQWTGGDHLLFSWCSCFPLSNADCFSAWLEFILPNDFRLWGSHETVCSNNLRNVTCQCFVSIALRIFKITKSKDFDRSLTNLPRTGEQLPGDSGGKFPSNICRKQLELMDKKTWIAWLIQLKFCTEAKQTLLSKTSKQLFVSGPDSWCKYLANTFIHKKHGIT